MQRVTTRRHLEKVAQDRFFEMPVYRRLRAEMVVEKEAKSKGFRKYLPVTFLIGTGFFTMGLMDPLYDSYVTIFLSKFIPFKWLVGIFMSLDNILAIFLIPIISALSDKTRTKIGRRMPWIVVLLPLSAVMFTFIPYLAQHSLSEIGRASCRERV